MSKIELDDQILDHPKFVRAVKVGGSEAVFLWLGLRAYCAKLLTDGFVPDDMLDEVRGPKDSRKRKSALDALKLVNLVEECDGGVRLHDYLDWASSHDDVMRWRAKAKERQAKSRAMSQRDIQRDEPCDLQCDNGVSHVPRVRTRVAPTSPSPSPTTSQSTNEEIPPSPLAGGSSNESDPWGLSGSIPTPAPPLRAPETASWTHPAASGAPDQIPPSERQPGALAGKTKKPTKTRQVCGPPPDDFVPDQATLAAAMATGRDWQADWAACRDWHLAKGPKAFKVDYQATLRGWMRRGFDSPRPAGVRAPRQVQPNEIDGPRPKEWTG